MHPGILWIHWYIAIIIITVYFEPSDSYYEPVGLTLSLGLVDVATLAVVSRVEVRCATFLTVGWATELSCLPYLAGG